jgi:glycosyltransferase involved in cell wall biosynthesis
MRELNITNSGTVAYILKNFPKISETFITSEIYRLEKLGVNLKLYVIKPPCEDIKHAVVEKIQAERFYLPGTTSLSEMNLFAWLKLHFGDFSSSVFEVFRSRPVKTLKAMKFAFSQAVRARKGFWAFPRKLYLKEFFQAAAIAEQMLKDHEIKHIHAHFAHGATTVAWMVSIITDLKFSFTAHAKDIYLESLNPADFLRRKMDAAEFVITCTKANQRHLESLSKTPVHCLYHGLSAEFTELLESNSGDRTKQNGHLRALAVGRLVPKKGLDTFIEACGILQNRKVDFKAQIVGENGEHTEKLKYLIKKYSLEKKVLLAGSMTQNSLFHEYHNSDVFCLPCRVLENGDRDGIPNVMVEAMSCGLPVVSTDISGIPEIISNGENGVLVEPEDASALADSMQKICTDRAFAERLSKAGLKTAQENFNGKASAGKLYQLFETVSSTCATAALSLLLVTFLSLTTLAQGVIASKIQMADRRSASLIEKTSSKSKPRSLEKSAFELVNRERASKNLKPLIWNEEIATIAREHSASMAIGNFFGHQGLDSLWVDERANKYGIKWRGIGENIACNRGFDDPVEQAVKGWIKSSLHRKNLFRNLWNESGLGVAVSEDGKSYYFTQVFLMTK